MHNDESLDVSVLLNLRRQYYDALLACASRPENIWLAQIIASWRAGFGALPDFLGLPADKFRYLLDGFFPGYHVPGTAVSAINPDFSRMLEKQDLEYFLNRYASEQTPLHDCLVTLIVTACLGNDHLWQDLGLWSRKDLSDLLNHYFPGLSALNDKDMKWKKFLYKQLCEAEGLYVCRAPSCDVCKDYGHCFGPEE
ncbi:MAG: nitrogen fixation protein NifQ [Methylomonas sp.]|jgi:nitrogen fixation protein NifQ